MAEVGLVRFAHVAHEVAEAVLPSYRSKYSKHLFTQPALLAILCLMRYKNWTFREAEVRLGENQELCAALGLERAPDDTTLYRFLRRLDGEVLTQALRATVSRLPVTQHLQTLLLGLAYDIYRVRRALMPFAS